MASTDETHGERARALNQASASMSAGAASSGVSSQDVTRSASRRSAAPRSADVADVADVAEAAGRARAGESFDRYARMVRRTLGVSIALVTIVEADRQRFPGAVGLPEPFATTRETPLEYSFCQLLLVDDKPLVVRDTRLEAVLKDSPAVSELGVVSYAAWPLRDHTGATVGALCAIDRVPREWTEDDLDALADLAAACSAELSQRELQRGLAAQTVQAEAQTEHARVLLSLSEALAETRTLSDVATAIEPAGAELGCTRVGMWLNAGLRDEPGNSTGASSGAPAGGSAGGSVLRFVPTDRDEWARASKFADMAADGSNPIGAVYESGEALMFADHAAQNARYPEIATSPETGEARFFVPLRAGLDVFGTLVLIWPNPITRFTRDLGNAITSLAAYAAQAVHRALLLQERVDAAVVLQHAMLSDLPVIKGLELAAKYRPAAVRDQVGGDWYDVLPLRDGTTLVAIGDVVGHDLEAAATMAQYRSMLRALAWPATLTPAQLLTRLDETADATGIGVLTSLTVAIITAPNDHPGNHSDDLQSGGWVWNVVWANAGHLPSLLIPTSGRPQLLRAPVQEPLLGINPHASRIDHTLGLGVGDTLVLYTDGLVERRGENIDIGLDRLMAAAEQHARQSCAELVVGLSRDLVIQATDDIAMLVVRPQRTG